MKEKSTQIKFKNVLDTYNFDVLFLQETHVDSMSLANSMKEYFNCEAFWSLGSNRSAGVGIFLSNKTEFKVEKFHTDIDGRFLYVDLLIESIPYRLVSVYAPNDEKDRKEFFNSIQKHLVSSRKVIIGGDFNCILDTKYDKIGKGSNPNFGWVGSKELSTLCHDYNLTDVFRTLNPYRYATTWHSPASKDIHTRLDRFYVSKSVITDDIAFNFYPVSFSDHDIFSFTFKNPSSAEFGTGYWKFNDNLLNDREFTDSFRTFYKYHTRNLDVSLKFWDNLKSKIKNFCILYCKKTASEKFNELRKLRQKYSILLQNEIADPGSYYEQAETLRVQIDKLENENLSGAKIRAKIEILKDEENPSYFFSKVEQNKSKKKTISKVECNGEIFSQSKDILNCFRNFYQDLYTAEPIDNDVAEMFLNDLPSLSSDDSSSLEMGFSLAEFETSLKEMQDNKSPGPDGLTKAFYVKFFDLIGETLVQLSRLIFENKHMTESQRLSYITLLCKDPNNATNMKNWRPISLLNYDYKIISKSITKRLSTLIETLVHKDQTCAVKGRSIFDNVHLLRNVIDYVEQKDLPCIFLNLDQEKAFDRVSYDFLFKCLRTYGFGENFIRWITILYTDIQSSVLVNQFISDPINISRGVRQGCSLSPLLYVLCIEPFVNQIRLDPNIHGISIPGSSETVKVICYADDGTGALSDLQSAKNFLDKSKLFGRASGAKLNVNKTRGMFLGKWKSRSDHPFGISWVDSTKLLGNTLGNFLSNDDVWSKTLGKIQKTLNVFKTRSLTYKSKSYIINSLALSKLWYLGSTNLMSDYYVKQFNRTVFDFLWTCKSEPLSRDTLYLPFKLGGQNLVNISSKLDCLLLKHVQSLISGTTSKWRYFAIYWIGLYLRKYNPDFASLKIPHSDKIPPFYKRCLDLLKTFELKAKDIKIGNLTCKQFYVILSSSHIFHPHIESVHPKVDFNNIWHCLQDKFIDPFSRDIAWRCAHEILPVQKLLYKYKISKIQNCILCNHLLESTEHLFFSCPLVSNIYDLMYDWIRAIAYVPGHDIPITSNLILRYMIPSNISLNKYQKSLILYLLCECKYCIWNCRNLKKFENRRVNSNYIIMFMLHRLKVRIHADFKRMPFEIFQQYWIEPAVFCQINEEKLELLFDI